MFKTWLNPLVLTASFTLAASAQAAVQSVSASEEFELLLDGGLVSTNQELLEAVTGESATQGVPVTAYQADWYVEGAGAYASFTYNSDALAQAGFGSVTYAGAISDSYFNLFDSEGPTFLGVRAVSAADGGLASISSDGQGGDVLALASLPTYGASSPNFGSYELIATAVVWQGDFSNGLPSTLDGLVPSAIVWTYTDTDGPAGNNHFIVAYGTEVPVPAAVWLFGSALVALAGVGRRRG